MQVGKEGLWQSSFRSHGLRFQGGWERLGKLATEVVLELAEWLCRNKCNIWLDQSSLWIGSIMERTANAIDRRDIFVVILSGEYTESEQLCTKGLV